SPAVTLLWTSPAGAAGPTFEPAVPLLPSDVTMGAPPVDATNGTGTSLVAWSSRQSLRGTIDVVPLLAVGRCGLTFGAPAALNRCCQPCGEVLRPRRRRQRYRSGARGARRSVRRGVAQTKVKIVSRGHEPAIPVLPMSVPLRLRENNKG